mmetsp:Transcript_134813/g.430827  ORF Transcript_134813/g.430827 Transcript_134813/m.430827 type:complete len:284 (-) Transcript_134813:250-1101(-)
MPEHRQAQPLGVDDQPAADDLAATPGLRTPGLEQVLQVGDKATRHDAQEAFADVAPDHAGAPHSNGRTVCGCAHGEAAPEAVPIHNLGLPCARAAGPGPRRGAAAGGSAAVVAVGLAAAMRIHHGLDRERGPPSDGAHMHVLGGLNVELPRARKPPQRGGVGERLDIAGADGRSELQDALGAGGRHTSLDDVLYRPGLWPGGLPAAPLLVVVRKRLGHKGPLRARGTTALRARHATATEAREPRRQSWRGVAGPSQGAPERGHNRLLNKACHARDRARQLILM